MSSYREATARQRVAQLFDPDSVAEILPPSRRVVSPHLALFDAVAALDDGVMIGRAQLGGQAVLFAAQEGGFMGGAVGEVHGAKLTGLLQRAQIDRPAAVILLLESGGVRLQEANAGLIAVSETMRALLAVRAKGIAVWALIGGSNGCFGGAGILAACCNRVIMSEEGRWAMSGPEVIESAHGVEEYDAKDRALVWRTTGGKHRYLLGDCDQLVPDRIASFRQALLEGMAEAIDVSINAEQLQAEHQWLARRLDRFGSMTDSRAIWQALGVPDPDQLPLMDVAACVTLTQALRMRSPVANAEPRGDVGLPVNPPMAAQDQRTATCNASADDGARQAGAGTWQGLLNDLFPDGHDVVAEDQLLHGSGRMADGMVAVIGTCEHAPVGVECALRQASLVLDVVRQHPARPILLLVDTVGQRLRHRDEMLGIYRYMAHLGKCIELARGLGHKVVALVYDQALSGGFLTSGMMADSCHALQNAQIRVMALPAMARITKVEQARLEQLAQHNPVFAPGAENYWKMGGVASMWNHELATCLIQALAQARPLDTRAQWGAVRGGRTLAQQVMQMVVSDVAPA